MEVVKEREKKCDQGRDEMRRREYEQKLLIFIRDKMAAEWEASEEACTTWVQGPMNVTWQS